ncbi:MAG: leucyl aminopeptidase [Burkholderiales bacterium]
MEFSTKTVTPEKAKSGCVVVGVYESAKLTASALALDKASKQHIGSLLKRGDMNGKAGSTLLLHRVPNIAAERILLVGLGKDAELGDKSYREMIRAALRAVGQTGAVEATLFLLEVPVKQRDVIWKAEHTALIAGECTYRFENFKGTPERNAAALKHIALAVDGKTEQTAVDAALRAGHAIAEGIIFAKDLGNTPPNVCTPAYLADTARKMAKSHGLKVEVLEHKDMEKLGMGSLLSVSKGSRNPPKFIILQHNGGNKGHKPAVLVGKGITFDTGGISIKPASDMDEMKYDMSGAGSVLGAMKAIALMKLSLNVIGLIPSCENMPDGNASRPGDIVKSMSGQTIEILNTDAEGRLILCDALTYAERYEPSAVIDIATLTGACVVALGTVASGMYANKDGLAQEVITAGERAHDRVWQMPLWDDYQEQLRSNFADMANIGGRPAGSVTAACFLSRFAKKFDWAHLDVAGTAYKSGREKGSTGRPVGLLCHFLMARAAKQG